MPLVHVRIAWGKKQSNVSLYIASLLTTTTINCLSENNSLPTLDSCALFFRSRVAKYNHSNNNRTIRVGDCDVGEVSVVRNLGAWFDDQLTMAVHITKICSAAFYHLHNIY